MPPSHLPWIKLYTDILDDPVIGRLPISTKWRFIEILLLAGQCDAEGYLVDGNKPYTESDLAWRLRISEEQLQSDLQHLADSGLVIPEGDTWLVPSFSDRQGRSKAEKRLRWREQKRRQRAARQVEDPTSELGAGDLRLDSGADKVPGVRADTEDNVHPVHPLEEEGEEDIEKEEEREDIINCKVGSPKKPPDPSPPMMMKNSSPTDYFCDSFGIGTLTPEQYNTLNDLAIHYGPELLCKIIDWAVSRQIHPKRAVCAIKTAIAGWQDKPRLPIQRRDPNAFDPNVNYYEVYREALESGRLDKYLARK